MTFVPGSGVRRAAIPADVVNTRPAIAREVICRIHTKYGIAGAVLEPCRGAGAFYDQLPDTCTKDWCEILEDRCFFSYNQHVDWIITNPPYSIFGEFLAHSMEISDHIVFLIPIAKVLTSKAVMDQISNWGGIVEIYAKWGGRQIGFPFGFPSGYVYMRRGYKEPANLFLPGHCR